MQVPYFGYLQTKEHEFDEVIKFNNVTLPRYIFTLSTILYTIYIA